MTHEEVMAVYRAPIYQHYKKVMEFVLRNARKNGVEVSDEGWKRTADDILKGYKQQDNYCLKAAMYAWANYLKKTI